MTYNFADGIRRWLKSGTVIRVDVLPMYSTTVSGQRALAEELAPDVLTRLDGRTLRTALSQRILDLECRISDHPDRRPELVGL